MRNLVWSEGHTGACLFIDTDTNNTKRVGTTIINSNQFSVPSLAIISRGLKCVISVGVSGERERYEGVIL